MISKIFYICLAVRLSSARYALPRPIDEQAAELPTQMDVENAASKLYYRPLQSYPSYQIITPAKSYKSAHAPGNVALSIKSDDTTTTTPRSTTVTSTSTTAIPPSLIDATTGNTIYTAAEFPHDLLEIARHKLGLRSLDEVPSISELAEFLGTSTAEETIKYIRQLTSTDQGIALMKAYLESADYTDRTDELRRKQQQEQASVGDGVAETTRTKAAKGSVLERIAAYFHIYNLWPQNGGGGDGEGDGKNNGDAGPSKQFQQLSQLLKPQLQRMKNMQLNAPPAHRQLQPQQHAQRPMLVRSPLPYHYPIPLRPLLGNRLSQGIGAPPVGHSPVHLNTPKFHVPPHIHLARMTNIPPHHLQSIIQSKPKLAELAAKVSRFSLAANHENGAQMDAQLMAAVRRAIEQDEDLKKLLQTTAASLL